MSPDRPPLHAFDRLVVPILGTLAATLLFALMVLTVVDVVGRYFGRPVFGGFELTEVMLAALIFAGLPLVTLRGDHVTVDLFDAVTPESVFRVQHVVASIAGCVCTGFVAWRLWLRAAHIAEAGEVTGQLKLPLSWLAYTMSVLMAVTALALLVLVFVDPSDTSRQLTSEGQAMTEALVALGAFLILAFLRLPMAFAMGIVGFAGTAYKLNFNAAAQMVATITYETGLAYSLSVIPLFILMGNFVVRARMSEELFHAAHACIGHWRGGLAMSTIVASGGFGSICGSSIATSATFAKVAYPSMRRFGYSDALAAGAIASGGTLGILIPPSVLMVIYAIMTETNIGKLFVAGILPGLVATLMLCGAVVWVTRRDPTAGPPAARASGAERLAALRRVWPVLLLFAVVIGGIYAGLFTATEGAGIGATVAFFFALARRALSWRVLGEVLIESARTTSMLFMVLIGAMLFANFVNYTSMPADLKSFVTGFDAHPSLVIVAICLIYIVLGAAMEELSMILLTVPLFFPVVTALGYDPLWFGVVIVIVVQIGLVSPPVGMNMFVVKNLLRHIPIGTVFRGVWPFAAALVVTLGVIVAVPELALWLPRSMK